MSFVTSLSSVLACTCVLRTACSSDTNLTMYQYYRLYTVQKMRTHHFTLAHKASSIAMRATTCRLPEESQSIANKTANNITNAPSSIRRKFGCSEEPGLSMFEMNASAALPEESCSELDISSE